jgi:acyl-CoA thioester hydrolase
MANGETVTTIRVRYSETDQMGTFYNARALEWLECGRNEHFRTIGLPYTEVESRGVFLPIIEAHIRYRGRARYDDELQVVTRAAMSGNARVRFDARICHRASGAPVVEGYTIHACTGGSGRPIRPPDWFVDALGGRPPRAS